MRIVTLKSRPDLLDAAMNLGDVGGEFIYAGYSGKIITPERLLDQWGDTVVIALENDVPIARALSVPVAFPAPDRVELPDHGWDQAIQWAMCDIVDGRTPTTLCALEVVIAPRHRGTGLSAQMLKALKGRAMDAGLSRLIVSVRPIGKEDEPDVPFAEYVARRRADGLSADRWLRTHERLGAQMIKICPFAVTIADTLANWHEWTRVTFTDGENHIPGGIAPVHATLARDHAVYVEPNVWMEHPM